MFKLLFKIPAREGQVCIHYTETDTLLRVGNFHIISVNIVSHLGIVISLKLLAIICFHLCKKKKKERKEAVIKNKTN